MSFQYQDNKCGYWSQNLCKNSPHRVKWLLGVTAELCEAFCNELHAAANSNEIYWSVIIGSFQLPQIRLLHWRHEIVHEVIDWRSLSTTRLWSVKFSMKLLRSLKTKAGAKSSKSRFVDNLHNLQYFQIRPKQTLKTFFNFFTLQSFGIYLLCTLYPYRGDWTRETRRSWPATALPKMKFRNGIVAGTWRKPDFHRLINS